MLSDGWQLADCKWRVEDWGNVRGGAADAKDMYYIANILKYLLGGVKVGGNGEGGPEV